MKYQMRRHGNIYKVYETDTKRYIAYSTKSAKIRNIVKNLNEGGAFDGNFPSYFFGSDDPKVGFELQRDHQPAY